MPHQGDHYVPLNNLDLLDERGTPDPYAELLDDLPYEPTLEEVYEGASEEVLDRVGYEAFLGKCKRYQKKAANARRGS